MLPEKAEEDAGDGKRSKKILLPGTFKDISFADVMIVGAGISGIQAALDLATAGFKNLLG